MPPVSSDDAMISSLIRDCKIAFDVKSLQGQMQDYSAGSTYFIGASESATFDLEELALAIFKYHTKDLDFDPAQSGVEW